MATYSITLTSESFGIGDWHPELQCDEVFLGVVPTSIFNLIGWKTKRQGYIEDGEGAMFVTRKEMIDAARTKGGLVRHILLKTLLKTERAKRKMLGWYE